MTTCLHLGAKSPLELSLPPERLVACCGRPTAASLADVHAATAEAIAQPLGFPPLVKAVVPGDRVVLALDHDVPHAHEIVGALCECLLGAGVQPSDLTLLAVRPHAEDPDPRSLLPAAYRDTITVELHDPAARDHLSYLAVGANDEPIYLNRVLCDADVVVPIGCLRCEPALDYQGTYGGLFPTFAGQAAQDKLFAAGLQERGTTPRRDPDKIEEVGWLLGVQLTVQVVPGPAGELLQVLAGLPAEVFRAGQAACQRAWSETVPRSAQLVVASIDGPAGEQSWDNVARAVTAALRVVSAEGAIAICTALTAPPDGAVRRAIEAGDIAAVRRQFRKHREADALVAVALAQALSQTRVYLLSELDEEMVEELGVTPVATAAELARLVGSSPSCICIANAQYAVVNVDGE